MDLTSTPEITANQANEAITAGATVLDVREIEEFEAGHIAGAISLPLSTIVEEYQKIEINGSVIVNCRSGARSARATAFLRSVGIDARNLKGGVIAWTHAGLPLVTDNGEEAFIA